MNKDNILPTILLGVTIYFGYTIYQNYQKDIYPSSVEVVGISLSTIGAFLTGALGFLSKFFQGNNTISKIVKIIELTLILTSENLGNTWTTIKEKFEKDGLPVYIGIRFSWGKGQSYPIEIGIDPEKEEDV